MPDLVEEYFERDLTLSEWEALERQLESSTEDSSRFAELARRFYLDLGLPDPAGPSGGSGLLGNLGGLAMMLAAIGFLIWGAFRLGQTNREVPNPVPAVAPALPTETPTQEPLPEKKVPSVLKPMTASTDTPTSSPTATPQPKPAVHVQTRQAPPLPPLPTATPTSRPSLFPKQGFQGLPLNQ